jgi:hypothetical protein
MASILTRLIVGARANLSLLEPCKPQHSDKELSVLIQTLLTQQEAPVDWHGRKCNITDGCCSPMVGGQMVCVVFDKQVKRKVVWCRSWDKNCQLAGIRDTVSCGPNKHCFEIFAAQWTETRPIWNLCRTKETDGKLRRRKTNSMRWTQNLWRADHRTTTPLVFRAKLFYIHLTGLAEMDPFFECAAWFWQASIFSQLPRVTLHTFILLHKVPCYPNQGFNGRNTDLAVEWLCILAGTCIDKTPDILSDRLLTESTVDGSCWAGYVPIWIIEQANNGMMAAVMSIVHCVILRLHLRDLALAFPLNTAACSPSPLAVCLVQMKLALMLTWRAAAVSASGVLRK